MDAKVRRQAELAERVRLFLQRHPSDDPACVAMFERITTACEQMRTLATAHASGISEARAATRRLAELRKALVQELLPHVERAVRSARAAGVQLQGAYVPAKYFTPMMELGVIARNTWVAVQRDDATLRPHGLAATLAPMLGAAVERYEALIAARNASHNAHVGARFALREARREVRIVTDLLDSFNRLRFSRQSAELGEWNRTRRLIGAPRGAGLAAAADPVSR